MTSLAALSRPGKGSRSAGGDARLVGPVCGGGGNGSDWGRGRSSRPTLIMIGNVLQLFRILITPTGRMQQIYLAPCPKSVRAGLAALTVLAAVGCRERP